MLNSILLEAEEIVNGARASDYGSAVESFKRISEMHKLLLCDGDSGSASACKLLMAVRLVRESNKHKRDNLVDLCGYAELLNRIYDSEEKDG